MLELNLGMPLQGQVMMYQEELDMIHLEGLSMMPKGDLVTMLREDLVMICREFPIIMHREEPTMMHREGLFTMHREDLVMTHPGVLAMMHSPEVLLGLMDTWHLQTMCLMGLQHPLPVVQVHTMHHLEVETLLGDECEALH